MSGLPKIALARLKANSGAPKSASPPPGPEASQGAEHPDANLLAAFVERTLTETERTQVLNHLSQCADCRGVAVFTLPAEAAVAEPSPVAAWRRWNPIFRWGAMAAVLGTLTVGVLLNPGMWNRHSEVSKELHPLVPAGNISSPPQTVSPPPSALPPTMTAQAKAQVERQESAGELALTRKAPGPHRDIALNARVARPQARPQVTLMASSRPPATIRAEIVPGMKAERAESKAGNALTTGAPIGLAPLPATVTTAASEGGAKASPESEAGPGVIPATTQSVAVSGGSPGASPAQAVPGKIAPRPPAGTTVRMTAQAPMVAMPAPRKDLDTTAGPPPTLWSVSSNGRVQRSKDGGKTFEQIHIAHGVKFRAIAALGNDVWAGGTGGALFHSVDGGATWTRAGVNFEGNAVTETITDIQLHGSQHLATTTASGSQWISEDSGQHWQTQP